MVHQQDVLGDLGCPPEGEDGGWGPGDGQDSDPHRLKKAGCGSGGS